MKLSVNRYVTLMGDPIEQKGLAATLVSEDFAVASLASLGNAATHPDDPMNNAAYAMVSNLCYIGFLRLLGEKIATNFAFAGGPADLLKKRDDICIDKFPTSQTLHHSLTKYGSICGQARSAYMGTMAVAGLNMGFNYVSSPLDNKLHVLSHVVLNDAAGITRILRGIYRFHQVAAGNWAIVSMPKEQERVDIEFFKKRELALQRL